MNEIELKKKVLENFGIEISNSLVDTNTMHLKYGKVTIFYSTNNFSLYNIKYLILDILKKLDVYYETSEKVYDIIENTKYSKNVIESEEALNEKRRLLEKMKIEKYWKNNYFHLKRGTVSIIYDFNEYLEKEPNKFIIDVVNKLKIAIRDGVSCNEEEEEDDDSDIISTHFISTPNPQNSNIVEKKQNIKKILIERGLLTV